LGRRETPRILNGAGQFGFSSLPEAARGKGHERGESEKDRMRVHVL
jgi:hypothetical protein